MAPAELNAVEKALDLVAARIDHLEERMLLLDARTAGPWLGRSFTLGVLHRA
jgi:hypothetical protein